MLSMNGSLLQHLTILVNEAFLPLQGQCEHAALSDRQLLEDLHAADIQWKYNTLITFDITTFYPTDVGCWRRRENFAERCRESSPYILRKLDLRQLDRQSVEIVVERSTAAN